LVDPLAAELARDVDRAFELFVKRYQHRLYGFVLTLTHDPHEAEEVAQASFVAAYEALLRYDEQRRKNLSLRPWLFTIALNRVRNRARRASAAPLDEALAAAAPSGEAPEHAAERDEAVAAVRAELQTLAPRYRVPVVLRHIHELSYDEIAQVLRQPVGTAKANVHRGLGLLRASAKLGALT
jgi:RNA polymerase sigma-70 factor (ECF subfamily)